MAEEKEKEGGAEWMQKLWRPAMGWMYMLICFCDMIIFPILWSLLQAVQHQQITQWNPLTLQGAGLFHIAMGAVLGIAAFGRTQEKLAGTAANPTTGASNGFSSPASSVPSTGGFGSAPTGFGSPAPATGFGSGSFGSAPSPVAKPTPAFASPAPSGFGGGLDPSDPPTRNTRSDG